MRLQEMLSTLDRVLRGDAGGPGREQAPEPRATARLMVALALLLGGIYGLSLGACSLFRGADHAWLQAFASAMKVPLLFLLTLLVTFPSLYVFAALKRLPLGLRATLRMLLTAIVVHTAVLAGLAPVFAFFAASTDSYEFMLLLNVAFFTIGGLLGLSTLRRMTAAVLPLTSVAGPTSETGPEAKPVRPAVPVAELEVHRLLGLWGFVYGVVGAQMAWLLRPFVGTPNLEFAWFRPREDNVFLGLVSVLRALFS